MITFIMLNLDAESSQPVEAVVNHELRFANKAAKKRQPIWRASFMRALALMTRFAPVEDN